MAGGGVGWKLDCRRRRTEQIAAVRRRNSLEKIGWGGRIRTFTVHINSVVSYQLDHAPVVFGGQRWLPRTG